MNQVLQIARHASDMRNTIASRAEALLTSGDLFRLLQPRIAARTQNLGEESYLALRSYLAREMVPEFVDMGFECRIIEAREHCNPVLIARRIEDPSLPTILGYGHGDVVAGDDKSWEPSLSPWVLTERNETWFGRGVVDNKGQHSINIAAMRLVLEARGKLGFNAIWLIEMGQEIGSPGLREICKKEAANLSANLLIASDGPRVSAERPTLYLGTRGAVNFTLSVSHRESGHHSGNWGGLLANPAIQLIHAIASLTTARGKILVPGWTPSPLAESVRVALSSIEVSGGVEGPPIDAGWGEPGLTAAEQLYGWSSFDVLAMTSGTPDRPLNAVPPSAQAYCQIRTVPGVDEDKVVDNLRQHLDLAGLSMVRVEQANCSFFATRLDPEDAWVRWVARSVATYTGKSTAVLPNIGASLANDIFSKDLGIRTIWVPHSYPGAGNHGGNEHLPLSIAKEALRIMSSLYWDIGDENTTRPPH